ncbi:unnamed protein product [Microthlaspi erraticum]|uniref:KIB1-4 beta-propeller domain-containing protein n=1 Tax=Microthlaspi erraticum TaxID=1685480 RepID=A0A6D2L9Y0_9BRAS|nr:unnamed protein product [Microthlaspi erraticum]CAA7062634.1 unnamed protein product [Microthlaspi erraticum]
MSLLLSQPPKLCFRRPVLARSEGLSSSLLETRPCKIIGADPCGDDLGKLVIRYSKEVKDTCLEKKVPMELMRDMGTIGSCHGWVATLKDDGILRLQDDLNPYASYTDPKRISLPPLVTLPHCQTQVVTNVSMSTSSPEDQDCVVAVKFLGPQLSLCRPAQRNPEWTNIRIENPSFFSSQVMYSKIHDMFRMPGAGGHLMGSWNLCEHGKSKSKLQILRYKNLPKLTKAKRDLLDTCYTTEHLVEYSATFCETFLVKLYKKTVRIRKGIVKMKTVLLMVFSLDEQGNAVYTQGI